MASISLPTALAVGSAVAGVAGTAVAVAGAESSASASSNAAKYNAEVAQQNQQIAQQNATQAAQAGEAQVAQQQMKTRAEVGAIKTSEAASGINVNEGSALDVQSSAKELGELSAIDIRSNAAKQAYGYETQGVSYSNQAQLDQANAANAETAGDINASSSLLGGLGNTASNYGKYLNQNSFN